MPRFSGRRDVLPHWVVFEIFDRQSMVDNTPLRRESAFAIEALWAAGKLWKPRPDLLKLDLVIIQRGARGSCAARPLGNYRRPRDVLGR